MLQQPQIFSRIDRHHLGRDWTIETELRLPEMPSFFLSWLILRPGLSDIRATAILCSVSKTSDLGDVGSCDITIWQQMLAINAKNLSGQRVIHDSDVSETILLPVGDVGRRILYCNVDRAWT